MKYLPTINLDEPGTYAALRLGQLHLATGQWLKLDNQRGAKPSRFVCRKPSGSIWAVHPQGSRGVSMEQFRMACRLWPDRKRP